MSVVFRQELLTDVLPEYARFVHTYWDNSPENEGLPPLDFNWTAYKTMDNAGYLFLLVGREDNRMVAAALYTVMRDLKRQTLIVAQADTFAVARSHRGKGIGRKMYYEAEKHLVALGVSSITNGFREVYDVEPLFPSVGAELFERIYIKVVG